MKFDDICNSILERVFHGTPHEIVGSFDLQKIGSGEGAQAYGWGLYFAESPKVANEYKKNLSDYDVISIITDKGKKKWNEIDELDHEAAKYLESGEKKAGQFKHNTVYYAKMDAEKNGRKDVSDRISEYGRDARVVWEKNFGNLYEVDIDADEENDFLDWDDHNLRNVDDLSSGKITDNICKNILGWNDILSVEDFEKKLKKAEREFAYGGETSFIGLAMDDARNYSNLQEVVDFWASAYINGAAKGEIIYNYLSSTTSPKEASEYLNSIGIKGIRYLDASSRRSGKGTYNYVIFDPSIIKIVAKNGEFVMKGKKPENVEI